MKGFLKKVICAICIMSLFCSMVVIPSYAENDGISVVLNNNPIVFDVQPQIIEGRTMVPMRAIFEALTYEVDWDPRDQSILAYSKATNLVVALKVGSYLMAAGDYTDYVNSSIETQASYLDTPPQIIDGRTLVPVRAVSEASRCDVSWDGNNRIVSITTPQNVGSGSAEDIKDYLRYHHSVMLLNGELRYMRYTILENKLSTIPSDYVITMTPATSVKEIAMLSYTTDSNEDKQKVVDAYSSFEQDMAEDLISQMPNKKFWGYIANSPGDTYSYFNWTNYENTDEFNYKKTKATSNFYWATTMNHDNFDFGDYFSNIDINLPYKFYDSIYEKYITITDVEFGETHATNKGAADDNIFVDLTVTANGSDLVYFHCYDKKGRYLDTELVSTTDGEHTTYTLFPKNTAKIVISDEDIEE